MWEFFRLLFCLPVLLILCDHRQTVQARPKADVPEPYQGSAPVKYVPELLFEASLESAASPPTLNQFPYYPPSRGDRSLDGDRPQSASSQKQRDIADPDEDYGAWGKTAADATKNKQDSSKKQTLGEELLQEPNPPNDEERFPVPEYVTDKIPSNSEENLEYSSSLELIDEMEELESRQRIRLDTRPIVFYQNKPVPGPESTTLFAYSEPLAAETPEAEDHGFSVSVLAVNPPIEMNSPESDSEAAKTQTAMEQREADSEGDIDLPPSLPLAASAWNAKLDSEDAASEHSRNLTEGDNASTGEPSVDQLLALWKEAALADLDEIDAEADGNATQNPFAQSSEDQEEDTDGVPDELARKVVETIMSRRQTAGTNEQQSASLAEPEQPSVTYVVPLNPGDRPPLPPDQPGDRRQGNSVLIGLIYQTIRVPEGMLAQMDKGSWSRADDSILNNLPIPVVAGETYISANYYYYYYYYDDEYGDDEYDQDEYEDEDEYDYEEYDDEFYYDDEECDDCDEEEENRPLEPNEEFSIITFFK